MKHSQLDSVYSFLTNTVGIPSKDRVVNVTQETPLIWNPTEVIEKYSRQSDESYAEKKEAINLEVGQINKYRSGNSTYVKNTVVYGAQGTGKSFVGEVIILYAIHKD